MDSEKVLDKIIGKAEHIADIALKAGVAYTGYQATKHWSGALTGLIALQLAQAPNLAAGLAGTGMLAWLGLSAFVSPEGDVTAPPFDPSEPPPIPGTQYIPPAQESRVVTITTNECIRRGGEILSIVPMTRLCSCRLPPIPPGPGALGPISGMRK